MGEVYGPVDRDHWNTMVMLKQSINYLMSAGSSQYAETIACEKRLLKEFKDKFFNVER